MPTPADITAQPALPETPSTVDAATPLVSVLVRSLDRPLLQEALASVATQTYRRIEVVVVAVAPGHSSLPAHIGEIPVRLIAADAGRPRSLAANVGLDNAQGDYLLFLDDDDWLMPGHIERLVRAVSTSTQPRAAYTGVALADADGQPTGQVLDLPFDAVRLFSGNLAPIHAVLFSKAFVQRGCRFDESLDRYEDWDFWLQLARQTLLLHVPGVSAAYRIHSSSGVHEDAGPLGEASVGIYQKWLRHWTPEQLGDIMRRVWSHDELALRLADTEARCVQVESACAQAVDALSVMTYRFNEQAVVVARTVAQMAEQQAAAAAHAAELAAREHAQAIARQLAAEQAATITQLVQQLDERTRLVDQARAERQTILDSTSWRLTRPLRWLASRIGGSRHQTTPR